MPFSWAGPFSSSFLFVRVGIQLIRRKAVLLVLVLVFRSSLLRHFSCHMFQNVLRARKYFDLPPGSRILWVSAAYMINMIMIHNFAYQHPLRLRSQAHPFPHLLWPESCGETEPSPTFFALKSCWRTWSILLFMARTNSMTLCDLYVHSVIFWHVFLVHCISAHRHVHFKSHDSSSKIFQEWQLGCNGDPTLMERGTGQEQLLDPKFRQC